MRNRSKSFIACFCLTLDKEQNETWLRVSDICRADPVVKSSPWRVSNPSMDTLYALVTHVKYQMNHRANRLDVRRLILQIINWQTRLGHYMAFATVYFWFAQREIAVNQRASASSISWSCLTMRYELIDSRHVADPCLGSGRSRRVHMNAQRRLLYFLARMRYFIEMNQECGRVSCKLKKKPSKAPENAPAECFFVRDLVDRNPHDLETDCILWKMNRMLRQRGELWWMGENSQFCQKP